MVLEYGTFFLKHKNQRLLNKLYIYILMTSDIISKERINQAKVLTHITEKNDYFTE